MGRAGLLSCSQSSLALPFPWLEPIKKRKKREREIGGLEEETHLGSDWKRRVGRKGVGKRYYLKFSV